MVPIFAVFKPCWAIAVSPQPRSIPTLQTSTYVKYMKNFTAIKTKLNKSYGVQTVGLFVANSLFAFVSITRKFLQRFPLVNISAFGYGKFEFSFTLV